MREDLLLRADVDALRGLVQQENPRCTDGLQNESTLVSTSAKIVYIRAVIAAGARRIEATSFVHPQRVPQMADAEAVMAGVPRADGVS
jgi:hydroxymethylglutaryl-CoA lyase